MSKYVQFQVIEFKVIEVDEDTLTSHVVTKHRIVALDDDGCLYSAPYDPVEQRVYGEIKAL